MIVDRNGQQGGGGSGIRTHDTVARIHAFQAGAFSHSAIPPHSGDAGALYIAESRQVTSKRPAAARAYERARPPRGFAPGSAPRIAARDSPMPDLFEPSAKARYSM